MRKAYKTVKPSDHTKELPRIRRVVGQLEGVEKMISEGRPCVDIILQARAVHSAVKSLEIALIKRHLRNCITQSAKSESPSAFGRRLDELLNLIKG